MGLRRGSPERKALIERVTALAERRDLTTTEIGEMLGVSRNCVAGIIHRVRQENPDIITLTQQRGRARRFPSSRRPMFRKPIVLVWPKLPASKMQPFDAVPPADGKAIWDVGPSECRWVRDDGLCCAARTGDRAFPFCKTHSAMVYKPGSSSTAKRVLEMA